MIVDTGATITIVGTIGATAAIKIPTLTAGAEPSKWFDQTAG